MDFSFGGPGPKRGKGPKNKSKKPEREERATESPKTNPGVAPQGGVLDDRKKPTPVPVVAPTTVQETKQETELELAETVIVTATTTSTIVPGKKSEPDALASESAKPKTPKPQRSLEENLAEIERLKPLFDADALDASSEEEPLPTPRSPRAEERIRVTTTETKTETTTTTTPEPTPTTPRSPHTSRPPPPPPRRPSIQPTTTVEVRTEPMPAAAPNTPRSMRSMRQTQPMSPVPPVVLEQQQVDVTRDATIEEEERPVPTPTRAEVQTTPPIRRRGAQNQNGGNRRPPPPPPPTNNVDDLDEDGNVSRAQATPPVVVAKRSRWEQFRERATGRNLLLAAIILAALLLFFGGWDWLKNTTVVGFLPDSSTVVKPPTFTTGDLKPTSAAVGLLPDECITVPTDQDSPYKWDCKDVGAKWTKICDPFDATKKVYVLCGCKRLEK